MTPAAQSSIGRAAALVVLLVAVNLWTADQFGIGVTDPGVLAGGVAVLTAVLGWVGWLLRPAERDRIEGGARGLARWLLSTPVLLVLYLLFGSVALTSSTVRVVSEGAEDVPVTVTAVDDSTWRRHGTVAVNSLRRFRIPASPFGRTVRVEAKGFLPATFTVYPILGLTVRVAGDLDPAPSVLFRPGVEALGVLHDGGTIRVSLVSPRATTELAAQTGQATSFLVGTSQSVPTSLVEDWRLELADLPGSVRHRTLRDWKRVTVLPASAQLRPDWKLLAEVVSRVGTPVARSEWIVRREPLQDVLVADLSADSTR